jgi:hypothetical protein
VPAGSTLLSRCAAVALLGAAALAHADYKETYSRGLAALKDGNYGEARALFQQALSEQPEPALRVRLYGQRWEPYLPQHYLGLAAYEQGDCATALAQWASAGNRKIAAQLDEIRSAQQSASAKCEQKGLAAKEPAKPPAVAETPAVAATNPPPDKTAATESKPAAKPDVVAKPANIATVEKPPAPKVDKPVPPTVAASGAPPSTLVQAFNGFLAGRYAEVDRLDPASFGDARSRFHAYVVRAAARYTLSEISGDKDLLDGARADARAARALDAKTAPDGALFSPRFRAFYREPG